MTAIEGVETQTNNKGEITHLTIDVVKHKDVVAPLLEQLGLKTTSKFEDDWSRGISLEDARKQSHEFIKAMWKK